jgi:hypothetical protein
LTQIKHSKPHAPAEGTIIYENAVVEAIFSSTSHVRWAQPNMKIGRGDYKSLIFCCIGYNRDKGCLLVVSRAIIPLKSNEAGVSTMKKLCKPTFKKKDHGRGAGIPALIKKVFSPCRPGR